MRLGARTLSLKTSVTSFCLSFIQNKTFFFLLLQTRFSNTYNVHLRPPAVITKPNCMFCSLWISPQGMHHFCHSSLNSLQFVNIFLKTRCPELSVCCQLVFIIHCYCEWRDWSLGEHAGMTKCSNNGKNVKKGLQSWFGCGKVACLHVPSL